MALLAEDIQEKQEIFLLKSMQNFPVPAVSYQGYALLEEEWVFYKDSIENQMSGVKRGMLGSNAKVHKRNTPVYWGVFFTTTIYLPSHYGTWKN